MADIKPIKPIKLCVNITIPTIDDDSISLYECVGILGNKLQEAIQKINESLGSLEGAYTADNPPPYPVTSVNGKTGAVVIDIPANVYTEDNPPPYPVTSVNRAETKDVITVFEPEGGAIEDVSQAELIAACKAGARLGAFNQDDGTCRLYHFNLYIDPERVDYNEVAGSGASGVISVNGQTGAVNIFNAPISAATDESVTALNASTNTKINQLKNDIGDAWVSGKTYAVGDYCISGNQLYKCKTAHTSGSAFDAAYWDKANVSSEISSVKNAIESNYPIGPGLEIAAGNTNEKKSIIFNLRDNVTNSLAFIVAPEFIACVYIHNNGTFRYYSVENKVAITKLSTTSFSVAAGTWARFYVLCEQNAFEITYVD